MSKELNRETLDKLVDVLLKYSGTPRDYLFEYPYRADESRRLIENAEHVARNMARIVNSQES